MSLHNWHWHPSVNPQELTLGQRAADKLRNYMGSWTFVFGFLIFMLAWAAFNTLLLAHHAFDKYPYILLNLMLSMLAGLQGAILLIASKRQDEISSQLAKEDYEHNKESLAILKDIQQKLG